jgi:hypothetical protein
MNPDPVRRLAEICLALPETEQRTSYGDPGWFVTRGPQFVLLPNRNAESVFEFWCAVPDGAQKILTESDPDKFFVPPHAGRLMWLGVRPGRHPDWQEVEEIVIEAYLTVAPKRLAAQVLEESG